MSQVFSAGVLPRFDRKLWQNRARQLATVAQMSQQGKKRNFVEELVENCV